RPSPRAALDLVLGGRRRGRATPRGPLAAAAATVGALLAALGGAAGTGWRAAAPEPDPGAARAVVEAAIPHEPAGDQITDNQPLYLAPGANFDPASAWVGFSYAVPASAIPSEVAGARERLVAQGWEATPIRDDHGLVSFWAAHGEHVVQVGGYPGGTEPLWANVHGRAPGWFTAVVLAAAAAGALIGWLAAGWTLRRRRPAVTVLGGLGVLTGIPVLLSATNHAVAAVVTGGWSTMDALFPATAVSAVHPLGIFAAAWLLLAALTAGLRVRSSRGVNPWPLSLWTAAAAHLAFAAAWCLVVGLYLTRLAANGGDRQGMLGGAYDPKDLVPFGSGPMNPFVWAYDLLSLMFVLGFLASPGLLSVSVPLLVASRRTVAAVSGRVAWRVLLVAAATALALPLAVATPLGRDALTWWLD
ncbi:hypothetical protein, partial [Phytohabitans flavus]|uniref:hypothetical protein n=1 Tax=Phytohabitans flavus TaxID=1076124 RepID=UPI0031E99E44